MHISTKLESEGELGLELRPPMQDVPNTVSMHFFCNDKMWEVRKIRVTWIWVMARVNVTPSQIRVVLKD